jgi:pimeloyl-ACP methyl ester carboxylesterase
MGAIAEASSKGWFTPRYAESNSDKVRELISIYAKVSVAGYAGCCAALAEANLIPDLYKISSRTLIVAGGQDRGFPPPHAQAIQSRIEGAKLKIFEDAAHFAPFEKARAFNALVLEHFGAP